MKYVLLSFGFFLVQNVSSFSRVARYTPSLSCILTSKKAQNLTKLIYRTSLYWTKNAAASSMYPCLGPFLYGWMLGKRVTNQPSSPCVKKASRLDPTTHWLPNLPSQKPLSLQCHTVVTGRHPSQTHRAAKRCRPASVVLYSFPPHIA